MTAKKTRCLALFMLVATISAFGTERSYQAGSSADKADSPAQRPAPRSVTPADFQKLERLWLPTLSPDGQWLAYAITRSEASGVSGNHDALRYSQRTEVWVAPTTSGAAKKIAGGGNDGVGFDRMIWSPDSQRLALEAATPDGYVGLWVWEESSGRLRKLVAAGLAHSGLQQWISEREVLITLAPDGKRWTQEAGFTDAIDKAKAAWAKGLAGREASVSVLDSGLSQSQPREKLEVVEVQNGEQRIVPASNYNPVLLAASARHIACLPPMDSSQIPKVVEFGARATPPLALAVVTSEGKALAGTEGAKDIVPFSLRWSPDGSQLAMMGRSHMSADAPIQLFVYRPETQALVLMNTRGIPLIADYLGRRAPKIVWTSRNELLIGGQPEPLSTVRADWWVVSEKEQPRNLTSAMKSVPSSLLLDHDGESLLGIAQGKLWRLHLDGSSPQDLSSALGTTFTSIFWPSNTPRQFAGITNNITTILLSSQRTTLGRGEAGEERNATPGVKGLALDLFAFDLASGKLTHLEPPAQGATFRDFAPKTGKAVYSADDQRGTHLWLSNGSLEARLVHETNTFLREIAELQWKKIQYRSLDGADLTGWVLLPFGYQEGKRYPLIANVYMGTEYGSAPPVREDINDTIGGHDGALLSAHGYAVLYPSMPRLPFSVANDNYMELTKGVMPAVDKVIDIGIADPHRLGVIGASYGGFSVYGLITQVKRFQAAVAMAGPSDWISDWGQFNGAIRYGVSPQTEVSQVSLAEGGQAALGAPPWKDVERYIRNSPIFYADRVETPVLIIQGDMDFVPIQQGEEFFMAMHRQGKRARFLRYWTSGHGTGGANMLDMWKQIYAWFDEFLMKPEKTETTK